MNKHAAEKIATEYYTLGVQLALHQSGLVKEAALPKEVVKKLIQAPAAGAGGLGAAAAVIESGAGDALFKALGTGGYGEALGTLLLTGTIGAGGMAGHHLAGKGVDKAHSLLSKLRK